MRSSRRLAYLAPITLFCLGAAPSDDIVPKPRISTSTHQLDVVARVGERSEGHFLIHNHTGCSTNIGLYSDNNLIRVDCDRWRIDAHESARCDVTVIGVSPGTRRRKLTFAASIGQDCQASARKVVIDWRNDAIGPLEAQREELRAATNDDAWATARSEREQEANQAVKAAEKAVFTLGQQGNDAVADLQRRWDKDERSFADGIRRSELKLTLLQKDNEALNALEDRIKQTQAKATADLLARRAKEQSDCAKIAELRAQKDQSALELQQGLYHSECNRTATQILAEDKEDLSTHLGRVGGTMDPAPKEVVDKVMKSYDDKITQATKVCAEHATSIAEAGAKWVETVRSLEAQKVVLVERQQTALAAEQAALSELKMKASDAAQAFHRARYDLEQENLRTMIRLRQDVSDAYNQKTRALAAFDAEHERHYSNVARALASVERDIARIEGRARELDFKIGSAIQATHKVDVQVTTEVIP